MGHHALLHPFAPPAKPESEMINIVRAEGSTLYDDQGRSYIDGLASLWYCQIGHSRPEMADAVAAQMRELAAYNTFDPFTNPPAARAAEMVAERSPLADGRVFFGCTGSDAVDTALKLARLYAQRTGGAERQMVIRRTNGYHGTNFGGTSAQGIAPNREGWGDLVPHFIEVPNDDIEVIGHRVRRARGAGGRGDHRAGAGRGRGVPADGGLPGRGPQAVRPARRPDDRRRGDLRLRSHRRVVRSPDLRGDPRHDDLRQGAGLPATCRSAA